MVAELGEVDLTGLSGYRRAFRRPRPAHHWWCSCTHDTYKHIATKILQEVNPDT
jgi:hypothetical protein